MVGLKKIPKMNEKCAKVQKRNSCDYQTHIPNLIVIIPMESQKTFEITFGGPNLIQIN
jgi:hypothetical protein